MAPPSQKYRQIGFYLIGGDTEGDDVPVKFVFHIRPEDLTRTEPSRLTVQQTLGGAWADSFDRGVSTISISGTTGWRGGIVGSGESAFDQLRSYCFEDWHTRRAGNAAQGKDPDLVQLYFVDTLDNIAALVAPKSFTLRRSKSSPLLMKYQIQLVVLDDQNYPMEVVDAISGGIANPLRWLASKLGLDNTASEIQDLIDSVTAIYEDISEEVQQFMQKTALLTKAVSTIALNSNGVFTGITNPILSAAIAITSAGRSAFQILASSEGALIKKMDIMRAASAYNDLYCSMSHGFNGIKAFASFEELYGASSCSSTAGGHAWSTYTVDMTSGLQAMFPPTTNRLIITPAARQAIALLNRDPLPLMGRSAGIGAMLGQIASGVTLT